MSNQRPLLRSHKLADRCAGLFLKGILLAFPALLVLGIGLSLISNSVSNEFSKEIIFFAIHTLAFVFIVIPLFSGICGGFLLIYHACKRDFGGDIRSQLISVCVLSFICCIYVLAQIELAEISDRNHFIHSSEAILESLNATSVSNTPLQISALVKKYNTVNNEVDVTHIEVESAWSLYAYSDKKGLGKPKIHFFRNRQEGPTPWKCDVSDHGSIAKGYFYLWCIPPDDPNEKRAGEW